MTIGTMVSAVRSLGEGIGACVDEHGNKVTLSPSRIFKNNWPCLPWKL